MNLQLSELDVQRLEACRRAFNQATRSKLTIEQYIREVLRDAITHEERIKAVAVGRGLAHVH